MKAIIVGCGRMGAGLAQTLVKNGHTVTVIDLDPMAFERLPASFSGNKVVGIGFDRDVLAKAGIERADGLAAVTESDEANAVIARMASLIFRVPKVVARLYDRRKAEIYKRLGIQTIDPSTWGINRIYDLLCYSQLNAVTSFGSGDVDIVEVEVPILMAGHTVRDLTASGEFVVISITRNNKTFLPTLGTVFEKRDLLNIAVSAASSERLKTLLGLA
ncbi:MAG TPA: TrkA family potassium uptake protein [Oscillospiraceae bacterium]|nr:TrkA family potassium uptake protein [Oscillospiraceae bacterium]HPS34060.1 TrkA family potassium uptake protein [Oscillospiraceae bacterium]